MGFSVGILADIYGPSMPIMFDVEGETSFGYSRRKSKMKPVESYEVKNIGFYSQVRP
jgi:ATP-binding protein involved in chromosome partitioning